MNEDGIVMSMVETIREEHDRFVFEQIKPWCEKETKMVVSKEILCRALTCFRDEHPYEYIALKELAESEEKHE